MKIVVTSYIFAPAQRQIDFSSFSGFDVRRLLAVIHAPTGKLLYAASTPSLGYTALAASVLTLTYDTTAMSAGDALTVFYDDQTAAQPIKVGDTVDISVILTMQTVAYSAGQVLTNTIDVENALRTINGTGRIVGVTVLDQADQDFALDVYVFSDNFVLGTRGGFPSISDANALALRRRIQILQSDFVDLGGCKFADVPYDRAFKSIRAIAGTSLIKVSAICTAGAPTFNASAVTLTLTIERD
ncbi:hypothetical protein G3T14_21775 [Methylobacterium sp. BTF04]|uniref:hypothetical protein n=1 Tax=Methylobacterium sp. BTF04 TaxID=2708300 RepID=UPI0013D3A030|nr:hypothetical protein [Methylobacterium sp. BTF04]NEU14712.1 hypothetical protein [Methylobacterium sp. BTF04]